MKILLSIGARAEDSRSMRMTDMGTSMVAGLGKMSNFWCIKYINLSLQVSEAPHGDLNLKGQGAVFLFLRDSGNRALGSSSGL